MSATRGAAVAGAFGAALLYLTSGIHVGPDGDRPPFDIDEAHKLSESYYYHLFFETGEWRHPDWHDDFYARTNPPVAKYLFGAALATAGLHVHDRRLQAEFERLWDTPALLRRQVPDDMLRVTRLVSAGYGAATIAALVGIGWTLGGPVAGIVAGMLLLGVPIFVGICRVGLTDSILMFHLTLTLPATLLAARALRRPGSAARVTMLAAVVPGVAIALAIGSKLNGALTGPVYALALLAAALVEPGTAGRPRQVGRTLVAVAGTAAVALGLFVLLDPALHDGPHTRLLQAYADFGDWMVKQQLDPGPPLLGGRERAAYVGFFTLRSPTLAVPRVAGALGVVAMLGGFALGIAGLTAALVASPRTRDARTSPGDAAVTLVWLGCVLGAVTAWIPVVWDRYVLPPSVAVDLCVALGPAGVGLGIRGRRRVRLLAVAATATGLAALTARVADPRWIDPRAMPTIRDREVQQTYVDAANERPACVTLQQHAATLHLMRAEGTQAADRIDRALALVGPLPPDRPALVRRCTLTRDLVRARLMAHDQPGAAEAAAAYVDALERIDAGLHTSDPMVRAAFDALTTNAQALATRLRPPS